MTLFIARNFSPGKEIHREIITTSNRGILVRVMGTLIGPPLLKGNKVTALEKERKSSRFARGDPFGAPNDNVRELPVR